MSRSGFRFLVALAWSFGVIYILLHAQPQPRGEALTPPVAAVESPTLLAASILRSTSHFKSAAVGIAGTTPAEVLAWRAILEAPAADSIFKAVLNTASFPGKLYALAGLQITDPVYYQAAIEHLRPDQSTVRVMKGCIVRPETVAHVVQEIDARTWTTEFLTGKHLGRLP